MILCQPNAGYYELAALSSHLLEFYLENDVTVVLWNYRGYGDSEGYCTMQNIKSDARTLANFVKKKLKPRMIAVHGISLGGHAAKGLSECVDIVLVDRTFSYISETFYI